MNVHNLTCCLFSRIAVVSQYNSLNPILRVAYLLSFFSEQTGAVSYRLIRNHLGNQPKATNKMISIRLKVQCSLYTHTPIVFMNPWYFGYLPVGGVTYPRLENACRYRRFWVHSGGENRQLLLPVTNCLHIGYKIVDPEVWCLAFRYVYNYLDSKDQDSLCKEHAQKTNPCSF